MGDKKWLNPKAYLSTLIKKYSGFDLKSIADLGIFIAPLLILTIAFTGWIFSLCLILKA